MISKYAYRYCCEDLSQIENYNEAVADQTQVWHIHHRLEDKYTMKELRKNGLYWSRPANELVFMTPYDHRLHHFMQHYIGDKVDDSIGFERLDEAEVLKRLGRKKKLNLTLLKKFIDILKPRIAIGNTAVIHIATTDTKLTEAFGSQPNVCNCRKLAQRIGLLKCVDHTYRFNGWVNTSKAYAYNKHVEAILEKLFIIYA